MRKIAIILLFFPALLLAQIDTTSENNKEIDSTFIDDKYYEDQMFFDLTYIRLVNTPKQISQNGFSFGLGLGFIKDLPINKRRNLGFGIGLAYAYNTYYFSLDDSENLPPEINEQLKSNKITAHYVELPIEFRIRTSTSKKFKFWRVYTGLKFSYAFSSKSNLDGFTYGNGKKILELNQFQYGATLSAGYNKWNLFLYYGLEDLFKGTVNNSSNIDIRDFRIGLIFYML